MGRPKTLRDVVRHGLCTGCGMCESIGGAALPMALNDEGFLRPAVPDDLSPEEEAQVLATCPGLNQRGTGAPAADPVWGPLKALTLGHATDEGLRFAASSAGVCTAAAAHLLRTGRADVVLHVGADEASPVRSAARVSRTPAEVMARVGARYGPAGPLQRLGALLEKGERIVVIGKPCDIAGVRNLARHDARVDRQVVATISFLCAGLPSHGVSGNILRKYGLSEEDVSLLRYRGNGCPGPTRIETRAGEVFEQSYTETWSNELNQGIQFRCKICPDSTGEQADLVCGDAWDGAEGYPLREGEGWSVILARTPRGETLLEDMRQSGKLSDEPLAPARLEPMQPHHARRKRQVLWRIAGMVLAGEPVPRYRGLGLARAALGGLSRAPENLRGMMRRLKRGNNRETLPERPARRQEAPQQEMMKKVRQS